MTAILLALLAGFYLHNYHPGYSALVVVAFGAYAMVEFGARNWSARWRNLSRLALATLVVFLVVIAPTLLEMILRAASAPYEHIHDGALQTELAMQFLLGGQTPYGQNYAQTILSQWPPFVGDPDYISTLHHFFYLPMTFLLPLPFYVLTQSIFHWFDVRLVSIIGFVVMLALLPSLAEDWANKLSLVIAFGLNPLFVPFFIEGRNDVVVLFWLVCMLVTLQRQHIGWSAVFLALACATKETAWLIVPFYFAYLWFSAAPNSKRAVIMPAALVAAAVWLLVILPFALWNLQSFSGDALALQAADNPIWGYGVSATLWMVGIIPARRTPFPFAPMQIGFGLLVMILAWRYQSRMPTLQMMLAAVAAFSFVVFFFSRNFSDNYLGYVISLALIAYFLKQKVVDR